MGRIRTHYCLFILFLVVWPISSNSAIPGLGEKLAQAKKWHKAAKFDSIITFKFLVDEHESIIDTQLAKLTQLVGNSYYELQRYQEGVLYLRKARKQFGSTVSEAMIRLNLILGHSYFFIANIDSAMASLSYAKSFYDRVYPEGDVSLRNILLLEGNIMYSKGNFIQGIDCFKKAIKVYDDFDHPLDENKLTLFNNWSVCAHRLLDNTTALQAAEVAYLQAEKVYPPDHHHVLTYMTSYAQGLQSTGQIERALYYYNKAISLCEDKKDLYSLAAINNNLSAIYIDNNEFDRAKEYALRALHIRRKMGQANHLYAVVTYNNLSAISEENSDLYAALKYLDTALSIHDQSNRQTGLQKVISLTNSAKLYMKSGLFPKVFELTGEALSIVKDNLTEHHLLAGQPLVNRIAAYIVINQLDSAAHYLSTLKKVIQFDEKTAYEQIKYNPTDLALYYLQLKFNYAVKQYENDSLPEHLLNAYKINQSTVRWLDFIKEYYNDDLFVSSMHELATSVYEQGVDVSLQLFRLFEDEEYIEYALNLLERAKAFKINQGLNIIDLSQSGLIDHKLVLEEKQLNQRIQSVEFELYGLEISGSADSLKLDSLQNVLIGLRKNKMKFVDQISEQFPRYHQLKHKHIEVEISEIRARLFKQPENYLVTYLEGEESIYTIAMSRDKCLSWKTNKPDGYDGMIDSFHYYLESRDYLNHLKKISAVLCETLFETMQTFIPRGSTILMIPSGKMSYINFETLFNRSTKKYLIEDYTFAPMYSINSSLSSAKKDFTIRNQASFLPAYRKEEAFDVSTNSFIQAVYQGAFPLKSKDEIITLNRMVPGETLTGLEANKTTFLKKCTSSDLIHLSAHAQYSPLIPLNSFIMFSSLDENIDNSLLKLSEVYGLDLNNKFIMLSACNTAKGQVEKGDGIINWAHAFEMAGVPLTGVAMWSIPEKATSTLLSNFYSTLSNRNLIHLSLRQTKLKFLKGEIIEEYKHPFYWGGIVIYGPPMQISIKSRNLALYVPLLLLLGLTVFQLRRRYQARQRQH